MNNEVADVINTFKVIAELPADSMGAYVISMARSASDVLAVVLLQREMGVTVRPPPQHHRATLHTSGLSVSRCCNERLIGASVVRTSPSPC